MPYLQPDEVLSRFAEFSRHDVRAALPDGESFVHAQVGSMASTLDFLSGELAGASPALDRQEEALREALDDVEAELGAPDDTEAVHGAPDVERAVEGALNDARRRLAAAPNADTPTGIREREDELLAACDDVLDAIDGVPEPRDRKLRRPLYGFLDARVATQLRLLGRHAGEDRLDDE